MRFTQRIVACLEHDDCTVIVCTDGADNEVWASHAPTAVDPQQRLNPDVPVAE